MKHYGPTAQLLRPDPQVADLNRIIEQLTHPSNLKTKGRVLAPGADQKTSGLAVVRVSQPVVDRAPLRPHDPVLWRQAFRPGWASARTKPRLKVLSTADLRCPWRKFCARHTFLRGGDS